MSSRRKQKPIIFTIDDEVSVLNAVERDLRQRYGKEFRIMKSSNGNEALDNLKTLKTRNATVALFVADQRMPEMEGTDFLEQALKLYPDAKKILLTAYADTEAAINSINRIGLDFYLTKPWDPPEQNLYPVLDDLLESWEADFRPPYDGIRVIGTLMSALSHTVKDFLARNRIPYQWVDINSDPSIEALIEQMDLQLTQIPIILFPDGTNLVTPTIEDVAEKLELKMQASEDFYDLIIIGGGPGGLAAGVYGASEGLRSLIIEKSATGGQAGTSSRIENYLGFPKGLSGSDLARRATAQAIRLGCEILVPQEVVAVEIDGNYKLVTLKDGKILRSHALIISSGVEVRRFNVPGEEGLLGAGVYYGAALTEAAHYRDQDVYVLGGGNSAGQAAMFFSRYAKKVHIVIRRPDLTATMSQYLIDQLEATPNFELIANTTIEEMQGDDKLET
ncbi:MAG: FAD-dependent oxidoreductase, partial [Candidatus Kariarchaeaceae archaeon]